MSYPTPKPPRGFAWLLTGIIIIAFIFGVVLGASKAGASTTRVAHRPGVVNVYARPHFTPGDHRYEGVDFTVCDRRTFAAPTQDASGADNDYALVRLNGASFELGAPRRPVQHCSTTLVAGQQAFVRLYWPRDGRTVNIKVQA